MLFCAADAALALRSKIGCLKSKLHIHNRIPHASNNHYVAVGSYSISENSHLTRCCPIGNIIGIVLEVQGRVRELYERG